MLHISASLVDYAKMTTLAETLMPLNFIRCSIIVEEWSTSDINVPTSPASITQEVSLPEFIYTEDGYNCEYNWASFDFQVF